MCVCVCVCVYVSVRVSVGGGSVESMFALRGMSIICSLRRLLLPEVHHTFHAAGGGDFFSP